MEKIYMEDNTTRSRSKKLTGSVVLSFVVALFAIFSLAVCGITQVTYAIDPDTTDSFKFYKGSFYGNKLTDASDLRILYSDAEKTQPVFCIEHEIVLPDDGVDYTKDLTNTIENDSYGLGILYILSQYYDENFLKNSDPAVRYWITQVSIWKYLFDTHPNDQKHFLDEEFISSISSVENIISSTAPSVSLAYTGSYNGNSSMSINQVINAIVSDAKSFNQDAELKVSNVNPDLSLVDSKDFYQSEAIDVSSSQTNALLNYMVNVSGIEGAVVVVDGEAIENGTVIPAGKSFAIRVPKDKVTKDVQTLDVDVVGNFNILTGYYFKNVGGDTQRVVSVGKTRTTRNKQFSLQVVGAPDTAMSTAQTIYFIGLVILLCGVGIVYANAKPSEIKQ